MTHETTTAAAGPATTHRNEVVLRGRVTSEPERRELPSGSSVLTVRVSAHRSASPMTRGSRQTADWVDCAAWGKAAQRSVATWQVGDEVEIDGALRRRFYRGDGGAVTRLEVEVLRARRVSRRRADDT